MAALLRPRQDPGVGAEPLRRTLQVQQAEQTSDVVDDGESPSPRPHRPPRRVAISVRADDPIVQAPHAPGGLGHRGRGAVGSALLGSVGLHCVLDAPCPVTVVRPAAVDESAPEPAATAVAARV